VIFAAADSGSSTRTASPMAGRVAPSTAHHDSRKAPTASAASRPRRWCLIPRRGTGRVFALGEAPITGGVSVLGRVSVLYIPDEPAEPEP
jgi:hypothetical protein